MDIEQMRTYIDGQIDQIEDQPWERSQVDRDVHMQLLALSIQLAQVEMLERIALQLEALNHRMEGA